MPPASQHTLRCFADLGGAGDVTGRPRVLSRSFSSWTPACSFFFIAIIMRTVPGNGCGRFEVTVTSVSLPPFVSRRGLSNTNQRLSRFVALKLRSLHFTHPVYVASRYFQLNPTFSLSAFPCVLGDGFRVLPTEPN